MKRIFAILMAVLALSVQGGVLAEGTVPGIWEALGLGNVTEVPTETPTLTPPPTPSPTVTPAPGDFRFRDGIRWGMNPQQVRALEPEEMTERVLQEWAVMVTTEKVAVSRFTADLVFMFRQERLSMITYEFQRQDAETDYQYLSGALCSLYGEKKEIDAAVIKVLMDAIYPGRYKTELLSRACGWLMADGTAVFQYFYGQSSFAVMYVSPELGGGLYQTNGL